MQILGSAKEMVDFIKKRFKIRQCKNFKSNKRVCLNYHIGRCLGPCVKNVSRDEYMEQIDQIIMLLERKSKKSKKRNGNPYGKGSSRAKI